MQKDNLLTLMKSHAYIVCGIALAGSLFTVACTDDDIVSPNKQQRNAAAVRFNIIDGQQKALAQRANGLTRGIAPQPLPASTFETHQLEVQSNIPLADACLEETTIEGFMPVKADAKTRGDLTTTLAQNFSSLGYRGKTAATISTTPTWFYNEATKSDGNLVNDIRWQWDLNHARFFAVYPQVTSTYPNITLSPNTYAGTPFVNFAVDADVAKQKDLMTACTGDVEYDSFAGITPETNLNFQHALTAITFAVGKNLSLNKTIDRVELQNVQTRAKYTLPTVYGAAGTWDLTASPTRGTVTLSGLSVSTNLAENTTIIGNHGENFTFMMIPQPIQGKNIKAVIHCTDGTTITSTLKGDDWQPGTTRQYKLTQKNSNRYHIVATSPSVAAAYDATQSDYYTIRSYRDDFDPATNSIVQNPVAWKVVKYEESADNGATWTDLGTTKPAWLTALSTDEGAGGTTGEQGTATLKTDIKDFLGPYNKVLKDATPKGTVSNPFNLADGLNGSMNNIAETANSYLISAPGYYCLPLAYGNSIKNNVWNTNSYQSTNIPTISYLKSSFLEKFKDHQNKNITNPWLRWQTGGLPDGAKIVWMDQPHLVRNASFRIFVHNNMDFLEFEVKKEDLRNGNAVIAATKGGTVVWSWHLWFDHADALDKIPCENYDHITYKFTRNVLGSVLKEYKGTAYSQPRQVRVTIAQTGGLNQTKETAQFVITQNPGETKEYGATYYQWGRKDPQPYTKDVAEGSFVFEENSSVTLGYAIQRPGTLFGYVSKPGVYTFFDTWLNGPNLNLWSANANNYDFNNGPVVKTIYDPCPPGFKVPAPKAFTGFTTTGVYTTDRENFNVSGTWNNGWHFNNKLTNPNATVYFQALGYRGYDALNIIGMNAYGYYWAASVGPYNGCRGYGLSIGENIIYTNTENNPALGNCVHPVADN